MSGMTCKHGFDLEPSPCPYCDEEESRVLEATHKRIAKLEAALRGICDHVNEFGEMMLRNQQDYGLGERIEAAEKLLGQ